jgi:hypothetical protein
MPTSGTYLDALSHLVVQNSDHADRVIRELSDDQVLWRPSPNRWSVAEWFEHLVAVGDDYQMKIREPLLAAWHDSAFEDVPYRRTMMGRCAVFGTRLRTKRSRGRGHLVPPAATAMSAGRFLTQQSELLDLLDDAREVDLRRIPVGSPLSRLMGPCLGDVIEQLVVLQHSGVEQTNDVIAAPGFPGGQRVARQTPRRSAPGRLTAAVGRAAAIAGVFR